MPRMERAPSWLPASCIHQPSYSNFIPEGPDLMTCGCINNGLFILLFIRGNRMEEILTQNVRRDGTAICRRNESLTRMQAAGVHTNQTTCHTMKS